MSEFLSPPESHHPQSIPQLSEFEMTRYLSSFATSHYSEPEINRMVLGEKLDQTLEELQRHYPGLTHRFSRIVQVINHGLGGTNRSKVPDAKNLSNCCILGFDLMKQAYTTHSKTMPQDCEQTLWFENSVITNNDDLFTELNHTQLYILEKYPDLANALGAFIVMSHSDLNTTYSRAIACIAAAEVYDSFMQMETNHE